MTRFDIHNSFVELYLHVPVQDVHTCVYLPITILHMQRLLSIQLKVIVSQIDNITLKCLCNEISLRRFVTSV